MGSKRIGVPLEILTGGSSGALAGVITTPLDVVKTRLQVQLPDILAEKAGVGQSRPDSLSSVKLHSNSVINGLVEIYKHEGMHGLFRGVGPRAALTSTQSILMFVLYEQMLHLMGSK